MHIACNKPSGLTAKDVPEDKIAVERNIAELKAKESGKPPAIGFFISYCDIMSYISILHTI
jgi:translation elongation factor EF-Ts